MKNKSFYFIILLSILLVQSPFFKSMANTCDKSSHCLQQEICVVKKMCAATLTKKDNEILTKYAINKDYKAIDHMIATGRVVVLKKGEEVLVIEKGLFLVKIKRSNGQVLYTDREMIINKK